MSSVSAKGAWFAPEERDLPMPTYIAVNKKNGHAHIGYLLDKPVSFFANSRDEPIEYIKDGKLRALAVTAATRSETLPDIPTVGDFVPGYEAISWYGVGAPKNTPVAIIEKLNKEINAALADPKMKARLADLGGTVLAGSPSDFGKLISDETEKWGKVIRAANIKPV